MGLEFQKRRFLVTIVQLLALTYTFSATAEVPASTKQDTQNVSSIPVGSLTHTYLPLPVLAPVDALYIHLFSGIDPKIYQQYRDKWSYQEMQVPFAATDYRYEHLSIGTRDVLGRAPYEGDVRRDFAQSVLRQRLDEALREYFHDSEGAHEVRKAQNAMNQIKSMPVKVGSGDTPAEIHFGYDVQSDASKFEYQRGIWMAGVYHSHLMSALTGQRPFSGDLSMRVSANLKDPLPSATLTYIPYNTVLVAALSKPLSRSVTTRLVSSTPVVAGSANCQYTIEVAYRF